jgi:hypothetical protein
MDVLPKLGPTVQMNTDCPLPFLGAYVIPPKDFHDIPEKILLAVDL